MKVEGSIRRVYAPLNITRAVVIGGTPTTQVYKSIEGAFEPNRLITPTTVTPVITVNDKDGIYPNGNANAQLSSMQWLVNGVDVTTLADYTNGLYAIDNSLTSTRGSLIVKKNVDPLTPISLSFRALLPDTRQGINVKIAIDKIMFSSQDVADDKYTIEPDQPVELNYNPITDGDTIAFTSKVYRGKDIIDNTTAGLSFLLYYMNGTNRVLTTTSNSPEIISQVNGVFTFDLRMIQKRDYAVALLNNSIEVASYQFSINRKYPEGISCDLVDYGAIQPTQKVIPRKALVHTRLGLLANPENYFTIEWHTISNTKGDVPHNQGSMAAIDADRAGLGTDPIKVYCTVDEKPAMSLVTDEIGNVYTDELGNPYIAN